MSSKEVEVFVICRAGSIERGGAKAFRLSRISETGEAGMLRSFEKFVYGEVELRHR